MIVRLASSKLRCLISGISTSSVCKKLSIGWLSLGVHGRNILLRKPRLSTSSFIFFAVYWQPLSLWNIVSLGRSGFLPAAIFYYSAQALAVDACHLPQACCSRTSLLSSPLIRSHASGIQPRQTRKFFSSSSCKDNTDFHSSREIGLPCKSSMFCW